MANFVTQRNALATALRAAGRVVYAFPAENITPPAIVLVPGSPYVTPQTIGPSTARVNLSFDITLIVGAADNQAALANIEALMIAVLTNLPVDCSVTSFTQPSVSTVGNSDMLISQIKVDLATATG
jgi:hypothetical protein